MEIIKADSNNFNDLVKEGKILVDFYATWCGPCKMLSPVLEEISTDRSDVKIIKVDVDECEDIARQLGIMSIPTMIVFKDGKIMDKKIGFSQKEEITSWLEQI